VQALLAERAAARAGQQWADADRLRDQIARLGWRVLDTANGQRLEPLPLDP
jgi:cysteinyl-tRNA synthetase